MKKIILILVASVCSFYLWSQGTLQLTTGATIKTTGNAYMILENMHVVNNGSLQQTGGNGIVKLTGGLNVNLSGSSATTINQLLMAKSGSASLDLQSNLSVVSNVTFSGGLLNLDNNILDLANTGSFIGESEVSRAFTTGTGYTQATGILNNPSAVNLGNLGAEITSTTNLGNTIIKRGHKVQTGISGSNNSIMRYFDIIPANNMALKATLRVYYFDAELNSLAEASLYHWKTVNLVDWDLMGADSRDLIANYAERKTYGKFDRITLANATAPGITCPANQTVSANMKGCKASVSLAANATGIPTPSIIYKIGNTIISSPYVFSKGTTTVTAVASNGILPDATCTFTVTVVCGHVPSITKTTVPQQELQTISTGFNVIAYPNPSANNFSVTVQADPKERIMMQVTDMYGRVIETRNVSANSIIRFGDRYRPGIYFVRIIQGKEHKEIKLIKLSD